jgi:hypothetical protein
MSPAKCWRFAGDMMATEKRVVGQDQEAWATFYEYHHETPGGDTEAKLSLKTAFASRQAFDLHHHDLSRVHR